VTRFLLATRSADKAREIHRILEPVAVQIVTLDDAGIAPSTDEHEIEAFDTFVANARAKARYFAARTDLPVLADDSGIEVQALDGSPGVRSKRFSGRAGLAGIALDRANNETLLERLRGVAPERRGARYVCAAVARFSDRREVVALGSVSGRILDAPAGDGGFGYDPLFLIPAYDCTFAQLDPALKNRVSHRARAFRALSSQLG
jgi:XTP/dITP diphosphohydrolase